MFFFIFKINELQKCKKTFKKTCFESETYGELLFHRGVIS
jgi:hypothetical protein